MLITCNALKDNEIEEEKNEGNILLNWEMGEMVLKKHQYSWAQERDRTKSESSMINGAGC